MDKYAELRAALESATPGPWEVVENPPSENGATATSIYGGANSYVADVYCGYVGSENMPKTEASANARPIAAANPDTIRALLAERDALRDALWVATEHNALHFGESHNTVIQGRAALAQEQGGSDAQG